MFVRSFSLKSFVKETLFNLSQVMSYGRTHPWQGMERLAFESTVAFIEGHCPRAIGVASQRKLFDLVLPRVGDGDLYLEFGVYTGGSINYLAVDPVWAGRGVGRRMMEAVETALRDMGCPKINLNVRTGNRDVIAFYERLGFGVDDVLCLSKRLMHDAPPEGRAEPKTKPGPPTARRPGR